MALIQCDLCGNTIKSFSADSFSFDSKKACFCKECWQQSLILRGLDSSGEKDDAIAYFREKESHKRMSPSGKDFFQKFKAAAELEKTKPETNQVYMAYQRNASYGLKPSDEDRWKLEAKKDGFLVVTSNSIEGYDITKYCGVATGVSVMGMGLFSRISDWGGENKRVSQKIKEVKDQAMEFAIQDAVIMGANALISAQISFDTIGSVAIAVIVNGTAVLTKKKDID